MRKTTLIQQHWSLFRQYYAAVGILLFLLACGLAWKFHEEQHCTAISTWPEARARIRSAKILQNNWTSDGGPGWTIHTDLTLAFQAGGRAITTTYTGTFTRDHPSDELSNLREGREIPIRYNPSNPAEVSLYPWLY